MPLLYNSANEIHFSNRDALAQLATPAPMGRFHQTIPFAEFTGAVAQQLYSAGIEVTAEEYAVSKDGNKFFGTMTIAPRVVEGDLITAKEWELMVGLRGSHDQTIPRGLSIGTRVLVCSNLCFSGDLGKWHTKQTTNAQQRLVPMIQHAVGCIPAMAQQEVQRFELYKGTRINPRAADAALVEVYRRGGLTAAQLGRAVDEYHAPTFAEHGESHNVWRVWNACTEALKPTGDNYNHNTLRERSQVVTLAMDGIANALAAA